MSTGINVRTSLASISPNMLRLVTSIGSCVTTCVVSRSINTSHPRTTTSTKFMAAKTYMTHAGRARKLWSGVGFVLSCFFSLAYAEVGYVALNWQPQEGSGWNLQMFRLDTNNLSMTPLGSTIACKAVSASMSMVLRKDLPSGLVLCSDPGSVRLRSVHFDRKTGMSAATEHVIAEGDYIALFQGLDSRQPFVRYISNRTSLQGFAYAALDNDGNIASIHSNSLGTKWAEEQWFYIRDTDLLWREGQIPVGPKQSQRLYQVWQLNHSGIMTMLKELREGTISSGMTRDEGSWPAIKIVESTWLSGVNQVIISRTANRWASGSSYQPYTVTFQQEGGSWTAASSPSTSDALALARVAGEAFRAPPMWDQANPGQLMHKSFGPLSIAVDNPTKPTQLVLSSIATPTSRFTIPLSVPANRAKVWILPTFKELSEP
jgi:hypothetical protein